MLELSPFFQFANEEKTGIAVLGIDVKVILLQAAVFLILFFIVKKYALKGIVDTLEHRRKTIDKGVELGLAMQKQKGQFDEDLQKLQQQARKTADTIIAEANKEASEIIKKGEVSASQKIDQMLKDANLRIDREMQTARNSLRKEMLGLVAEATEVIIEEKLDAKKDAGLIERALESVKDRVKHSVRGGQQA